MKVLMVCLGNICRSPMAEGVLQAKSDERGLDITIDSCGTGGWHAGEAPDRRAQQEMRRRGLDISKLRARQFRMSDFEEFDLIFTMDRSNFDDVTALAPSTEHQEKVRMILNEAFPGSNTDVPDPYYGGEQGFANVFEMLDQACDKLIENHL